MPRRLLHRADHLHRREQLHAHRPRGGVRPGALRDPLTTPRRRSPSPMTASSASRPGCGPPTCAARSGCPSALEARCVWINTYRDISCTTPFGGYKKSGLGRENGVEGIREYLQTKAVWISTAEEIANPVRHRLNLSDAARPGLRSLATSSAVRKGGHYVEKRQRNPGRRAPDQRGRARLSRPRRELPRRARRAPASAMRTPYAASPAGTRTAPP